MSAKRQDESDRERWDRKYAAGEGPAHFQPNDFLVENQHLLRGDRALDVACGFGGNAFFLARLGFQVEAVDISAVGLARARAEARRRALDIDWLQADLTRWRIPPERYDVILGVNGHRSLREYKRCLNPGGLYLMIGGDNAQIFEALLLAPFVFMFRGKHAASLTIDDARREKDLQELQAMLVSRALKPVIDRTFTLEETADAFRYVERKHVRGKVVITVS